MDTCVINGGALALQIAQLRLISLRAAAAK